VRLRDDAASAKERQVTLRIDIGGRVEQDMLRHHLPEVALLTLSAAALLALIAMAIAGSLS